MSTAAPLQSQATKPQAPNSSTRAGLLQQRKCACGSPTTSLTGECAKCKSKKVLQTKLSIGASNDPLEQEADRVADQVLAAPAHSAVSGTPPHIQRYAGQAAEGTATAPASVDRVLASSGRPLEPALQQDMEQRFGYDFSQVRVHSGGAAELSAREVNAHAYTVGHDVVFGTNRFAPGTHEGRRLLAHELTHIVQQSAARELDTRVTQERFSKLGGRLLQRDGEFDVPTLDQLYNRAVETARQTGNWQDAAEKLNGFNHQDIQERLATLTSEEVGKIHLGAIDNHRVGPDSNVAQLTKPGTPRASTVPPTVSTAPVAPPVAKSSALMDGIEKSVADMTKSEKLSRAVDWARLARNGAMRTQLEALKTPQSIFTMVVFAGLFIGAQVTPVGWVADALALTLLTLTVLFTGALVIQVFANLGKFIGAVNATSDDELKESGEALADAVATGGIALVIGLLSHAGRAVPPGRAPFRAPPSEGFFDALTADGEIVRVPKEAQKPAPTDSTSNQSRGSGPGRGKRDFNPPKLDHRTQDGAWKAGGELPRNGPERKLAIDSWTQEELEQAEQDIQQSIAARQAEQNQLGETSVGPADQQTGAQHRDRIEQEIDLLRAIQKKLGGT